MPSFILISPTVWPQYTNVTDRQDRQTTDRQHRAIWSRVHRPHILREEKESVVGRLCETGRF